MTLYTRDYTHLDHGYAATVRKVQGVTVDRAHVLASAHMDRHAADVALTRHRGAMALHWSAEALGDRAGLLRTLAREREGHQLGLWRAGAGLCRAAGPGPAVAGGRHRGDAARAGAARGPEQALPAPQPAPRPASAAAGPAPGTGLAQDVAQGWARFHERFEAHRQQQAQRAAYEAAARELVGR